MYQKETIQIPPSYTTPSALFAKTSRPPYPYCYRDVQVKVPPVPGLVPGIPFCAPLTETQSSVLDPRRRKKRALHSYSGRVPGYVWSKLHGRINIDCRGIGGLWERYKTAVFWQTDQYLAVFSTRIEKEGNTGFPGSVWHHRKRKGAQFGPLFLYVLFCRYLIYMTSIFNATGFYY